MNTQKKGCFVNFFFNIQKMSEYNENYKERLKKQSSDKYRNLSEEDKNKKTEYGGNRYHNMPEEKKQNLKEYQKITVMPKN